MPGDAKIWAPADWARLRIALAENERLRGEIEWFLRLVSADPDGEVNFANLRPVLESYADLLDRGRDALAKNQRLGAQLALMKHEADCYYCSICSPGDWTRDHCAECKRLQEILEATEKGE